MKKEKMLSRSQGNGAAAAAAFSTFALPAARRLPQQQQQQQQQQPFYWNLPAPAVEAAASIGTFSSTNPFLATGVSSSSSSSSTTSSLLRKRPGCECNSSSLSSSTSYDHLWSSSSGRGGAGRETEESPLDLSKPKIKVRQHWSGGSIVEVNTESAVVSIQQQQQHQQHPSTSDNHSDSICACDSSSSGAPVKVSVIQERRHQHQQPDQLSTSPWASAQRASRSSTYGDFLRVEIQWRHQPEATAARPLPQSPTQSADLDQHIVVNKPQVGPKRNSLTMTSAAAPLDDDLNRLADSAHQLRLSGFYYGHLSWKESAQLLQNTRVGTFLVRDSSDARYLYALSLQTDKGPTSVRIHYSIQGFRLDASSTMANPETLPRFRTVLDLVDHYVAKWSHCRDKGQFWLNTDGQVHSEVILTRPLIRSCQSLQHLCRLVYNKNPSVQPKDAHIAAAIPPAIRSYLKDYPFQH